MKELIKISAKVAVRSARLTMKDGNAIRVIAAMTIGAAIADKKLSREALGMGLAATSALIGYNYFRISDALYDEAITEMEQEAKED